MIEGLVGLNVRVDVALDTQEKETAFRHVESNLTDDLLKTLLEELLTHRADTLFTSLPLHKFLVKHFSQTGHINSGGWLWASLLHPVLTWFDRLCVVDYFSKIQKFSEVDWCSVID